MKKYNNFLVGLVVGAVACLAIAATQLPDVSQPFKVGSYVAFRMENDTPESGNITVVAGKWVKLETQYANGGPKVVRWVNTDHVRTFSSPAGGPDGK